MPSWAPTLIFVPLVGFALYRRFKRTFGRQPVRPNRMWFRIGLLALFSILSLVTTHSLTAVAAAGAGMAFGLVLAFVGLAHTTFEAAPEGHFYTTKPWVGLAVTALFVGRLAARIFTIYTTPMAGGGDPFAGAQRSPITVGIYFIMAAYYIAFYLGVMRKSKEPDTLKT